MSFALNGHSVLAIVPARGGSKGIPRKNIKLLAGRPLIAFTLDAALGTKLVDRIIVSTDDPEIAAVSKELGAEVPFMRPPELADDLVLDLPVFQHCLDWLRSEEDYVPRMVVHLRPTAPLRRADHIDDCIDLLTSNPEADSVRSVCRAREHPLKCWRTDDGALKPFVPAKVFGVSESYNRRRQDLPEAFIQNGSVDVIRPSVIMEQDSMSGAKILSYLMPEDVSVNIDTPIDWALAEQIMNLRSLEANSFPATLATSEETKERQ